MGRIENCFKFVVPSEYLHFTNYPFRDRMLRVCSAFALRLFRVSRYNRIYSAQSRYSEKKDEWG